MRVFKPFGKRGSVEAAATEHPLQAAHSVADFASVARTRLTAICRDLANLYYDPSRSYEEPVCRMAETVDPRLLVGHHAVVRIDDSRGVFILSVEGRSGAVTVETASDELLLDHIICHLALDRGRHLSNTAHGLVAQLVGHTLDDVERSLILATLRQHHFNRTHTAEVLGVSVRTVRNKIRGYREQGGEGEPQTGVFHLPRQPRRE
ncbi:helix-turn-helix domain-containing protein [Bosea sp. MMO-172]|uniref:helix-turn-helix domain-containing protein n=1 Tax=Bosea sp. MMO-172 TaxID=3127885 RepID=UPI0030171911